MTVKSFVPLLPVLVPVAARWVRDREASILAHGQPLSDLQMEDARRAGIQRPEQIRLEFVDTVPMPGGALYQIAKVAHLAAATLSGMALGHGISLVNPPPHGSPPPRSRNGPRRPVRTRRLH